MNPRSCSGHEHAQAFQKVEVDASEQGQVVFGEIVEIMKSRQGRRDAAPSFLDVQGHGKGFVEQRFARLVIDRLLAIADILQADLIEEAELAPGGLGIGIDVEFDRRRGPDADLRVFIGRRVDVQGDPGGPVFAQAPNGQPVEGVVLLGALRRHSLIIIAVAVEAA